MDYPSPDDHPQHDDGRIHRSLAGQNQLPEWTAPGQDRRETHHGHAEEIPQVIRIRSRLIEPRCEKAPVTCL
jgi:hypothetical protein